jgi:asparagine synthetase A
LEKPVLAQVVQQVATKWKRMALKQFSCKGGEGICTDMKAVREVSITVLPKQLKDVCRPKNIYILE